MKPLCVNCKWILGDSSKTSDLICNHPKNKDETSDLVKGLPKYKIMFCVYNRYGNWLSSLIEGRCGKSGRWFEPKK